MQGYRTLTNPFKLAKLFNATYTLTPKTKNTLKPKTLNPILSQEPLNKNPRETLNRKLGTWV